MKKHYLVLALISVTLISAELIWTRIFAAEYFYTFAFLILSIAVLGMGLGALALRLIKFLNNDSAVSIMLLLAALFTLAGPPLVIKLEIDFSQLMVNGGMVLRLAAAVLILSSTFFLGGAAMAYFFKKGSGNIARLYMADLAGAGAGAAGSVIVMNYLSTPAAVFLSAIPLLMAVFLFSPKLYKTAAAVLIIAAVFMSTNAADYLSNYKKERAEVIYVHWDAMSKIKVYNYAVDYRGINIDNAANSPVYGFDGNYDKPDSLKFQFAIDVSYLINKFDSCSFLSLGAGGGTDVLQALQAGASDIHAVEVNSHINYLLTEGNLAGFSGGIYNDKRVRVVTEDARTYIKRFKNEFDIIFSLSSNTFAALASGSFALAENYLFTTEAFIDYWNSLTPDGYMMMEHQFYIPRLTSEFIEAMKILGVENYKDHFAVYKIPKMKREIILISKKPMSDELREKAFGIVPNDAHNYKYLLYPCADSLKDNLVNQIVTAGWEKAAGECSFDISPSTDNQPFTAQMGLWKNFKWGETSKIEPFEFFGFPLSKLIIIVIMLVILVLIIPLNLIPYLKKGEKLVPSAWLYFFTIGAAFMSAEVILIQKYSLFIGASVYSILAVLCALLAGSAAGSFYSKRFSDRTAFTGIVIMLLLNISIIPWLLNFMVGFGIIERMIVSILFILPLGFFMGMPFPKGTLRVKELVDWGFAVNGAASVLGSVFIIYFAFSYGFAAAIVFSALLYAGAFVLLKRTGRAVNAGS